MNISQNYLREKFQITWKSSFHVFLTFYSNLFRARWEILLRIIRKAVHSGRTCDMINWIQKMSSQWTSYFTVGHFLNTQVSIPGKHCGNVAIAFELILNKLLKDSFWELASNEISSYIQLYMGVSRPSGNTTNGQTKTFSIVGSWFDFSQQTGRAC